MSLLDKPLTLPSGLTVKNRIVKAAMTENLADSDNQPTQELDAVYKRWAQGGSGMLVTGNLMVDRRYLERSRNVVADSHLDVSKLARLRAAASGTALLAQLSHPGRQTNRFVSKEPVAPSAEAGAVPMMGLFAKPRELTAGEIDGIVEGFGSAARRCQQAGLDGVQVHAAHGYLLAQFLSPHVNRRADQWGGDVDGRSNALLGAVRAARRATGPDFTIGVKLNSSDFRHGGFTEDDAEHVVRRLVAEGVDYIEISGGTYENPALFGVSVASVAEQKSADDPGHKEAYFAAFANRAKAASDGVPIMLTGGIRSRTAMEQLLAGGSVDLIGLARPLAMDPDLANKLLAGHPGGELPSYSLPTVLGVAGESEWYEAQIGRLGRGKEVNPKLSPALAATQFLTGEAGRGIRERKRRLKRAESAL